MNHQRRRCSIERSRRSTTPEPSFQERAKVRRSPSPERRNRSTRHSPDRVSRSRKHRSRSPRRRSVDRSRRRRDGNRTDSDDSEIDDRKRRRQRNRTDSDDSEKDDRRKSMAKRDKKRETSEERAHRKAEKKADKLAAKSTPDDALPYSNDNNPFNDPNLGQKFVWAKKKVRDAKLGISQSELARKERDRREETKAELEKLAKRRAEREIEQQLREAEMMRMQREADLAALGDWEVKEDEFHLEQAKKRAEIRIKENRAKPIDILAINMRLAEGEENDGDDDIGIEVDVEEPYHIFDNLLLEEVEELHKDIQFYLSLEKNQLNVEFWRAMIVVAEDRLVRMRATSNSIGRSAYDAVAKEAEIMLSGKSYDQLVTLQEQIQRKLASNEPMDIEYWEGLLKALTVWKAKAKLKDMHQIMLQKRLEQLRAAQRLEARKEQSEVAAALAGLPLTAVPVSRGKVVTEEEEEDDEEEAVAAAMAQMIPYERAMSPEPFDGIGREDRDLRVVDPEEDWRQLLERRLEVEKNKLVPLKSQPKAIEENVGSDEPDVANILYSKEATKPADLDELVFNTEAELAKTTYLWQDKYRPRKPRYFNRVHTGYEWNKYNQTHYDTDNPPPKVVQGYKFNIFYPDLINKNKTPTYRIEKEPGTSETILIRFVGGPPYEDIAFRVVNREWEYSHKKGFKSSFDRGVLQLHFHFKRNFYRK